MRTYTPLPAIAFGAIACLLLLAAPGPAFAQLAKATTGASELQSWLRVIVPVVCICAGLVIGLLYSNDLIRKDTLYQFLGGVAFAGAIGMGIVELFF